MSDEVKDLVRAINDSWLSNTPDKIPKILADCFHEDMMIKGCKLETLASGREACVRSYADFVKQAKIPLSLRMNQRFRSLAILQLQHMVGTSLTR
jgi:hypothetical protein